MEKKLEGSIEDNRGNIILENRKKMTLTGVEEVISFDDEKILLNTKPVSYTHLTLPTKA